MDVKNRTAPRNFIHITKDSGIPARGHIAFGILDRGTSLLQVRPITGCNLRCLYCSVDEGRPSRTRMTDYMVDVNFLVETFKDAAEVKGAGIEAHIDGQGEPLLYPHILELAKKLSKIPEVETISMQTNGLLLTEKKIHDMEKYVSRLNISLNALDASVAKNLAGRDYDVEHVKKMCVLAANSEMDVLIAPLWVAGWNDAEIPKLIEFALEIGAGKKWPALGIQKYIPHRFGRHVQAKVMSFKKFYTKLGEFEKIYSTKLVLSPADFGIERRAKSERRFGRGEILKLEIIAPGRMFGEMLSAARERAVAVLTDKKVGERVIAKIVRAKDDTYLAVESHAGRLRRIGEFAEDWH
jgi:hypothetical protein